MCVSILQLWVRSQVLFSLGLCCYQNPTGKILRSSRLYVKFQVDDYMDMFTYEKLSRILRSSCTLERAENLAGKFELKLNIWMKFGSYVQL